MADVDIAPAPQWASGLLPLLHSFLPHHSVTPPCHSPRSAESDDELLVPRLPAGILG